MAAVGLRTLFIRVYHLFHLWRSVLHGDCHVVCKLHVAELVSNRLFVRANTVLDYTWGRKFVNFIT